MKPIVRIIMIIVTGLFFVSFIGCSEDDEDNIKDDEDIVFDFVGTTWQIVSINGQMLEKLFEPEEPTEFETEFTFDENSWVFDTEGSFTGSLKFILTEKYTEPVSSMTVEITIKPSGNYTAEDTTLKFTKQEIKIDVVVKLEPKEVWEQQIEGKTVEELENDFAAENEEGFASTASGFLFKVGPASYTWSLEEDTLTLSGTDQKFVLKRASE